MPILNYTTTIDPFKTLAEIQNILVKHGAKNCSIDFSGGVPTALTFLVDINGNPINFRLPSNADGVFRALCKEDVARKFKTKEQAQRVAWRILKDWIESQMAIIQAGLATLPEVFLPYAICSDGRTIFQTIKEGGMQGLLGPSRAET
jgi:hypothetical protein